MHNALLQFIKEHAHTPVTAPEADLIRQLFVRRKLARKELLLKQGNTCTHMGFIVKGALQQYTIDDKGTEHVSALLTENWWAGDRESFFKNTPSIYNIEALEETDILLISKTDLERANSISAFLEMRVKLDENYSVAAQKRLRLSLSSSAEQRYEELMKEYPHFFQRFPQRIIASYLGITKETLSRIRNRPAKK